MDNLNSLQDALWASVLHNLRTFTPHFERIVMSHDASENPAELYGADGKIYYRKAGGAGAELGTGGSVLWEVSGIYTQLKTADDINMQSSGGTGYDIKNCGNMELYDGTVDSPQLIFKTTEMGGTGFSIRADDGQYLRFYERYGSSNIATLDDSGNLDIDGNFDVGGNINMPAAGAGTVDMNDGSIIDVGGITMNDATSPIAMTDSNITGVGGITMNDATSDINLNHSDLTNVDEMTFNDAGSKISHLQWIVMSETSSPNINMNDGSITETDHIIFNGAGSYISSVDMISMHSDTGAYIDMNTGHIKDVSYLDFYAQTSAPGSPTNGMVYFDNTAQKLKLYTSSGWETITSA